MSILTCKQSARFVHLLSGMCLVLFFVCASPVHAAKPVWYINDTNTAPYTTKAGTGYVDLLVKELSRRAGVRIILVRQPAERGLQNANKGMLDGDLTRIQGMARLYPNLVRVPEKLIVWEFSAFTRVAIGKNKLYDILSHPVGLIKGWKIYEKMTISAPHVTVTDNAEQLFRLLSMGRVRTVLFERWKGVAYIKSRKGLGNVKLVPLTTREMFIYLHRKHAAYVPGLAKILRSMKADGFYRKAYDATLKRYEKVGSK